MLALLRSKNQTKKTREREKKIFTELAQNFFFFAKSRTHLRIKNVISREEKKVNLSL
jgi:hypothetical protein